MHCRAQTLRNTGGNNAKPRGNKRMSYSTSTLLIRNLRDVFGENNPARRRAAIDEIYTEDCVFYDPSKGVYRGRDEIDRIAGAIKATHPNSDISQLRTLRNRAMAGWSAGYQAARVRRQLMPGLTSSLPGTAGLPPFIFFSTSYPELDFAALGPAVDAHLKTGC